MTNQKLTFSLTFPLLSKLLCFMKLLQEFAFPWKLFVNQQCFLFHIAILQRYLTPPFPVWKFRQWNTPTLPYDSVIATISSDILIRHKKPLPMSHPQNSLYHHIFIPAQNLKTCHSTTTTTTTTKTTKRNCFWSVRYRFPIMNRKPI